MRSVEDIASLYGQRVSRLAPRHARMRRVASIYDGTASLPLPELSRDEKAAVPNLVQQGTDQMARRAASVLPNIVCPPLRPGIKVSEDKADQRRMVHYGWWERSRIRKLARYRAGWFITYSSAPAIVRPDAKLGMPRWEVYSPFDVFPAATHISSFTPQDIIVRHKRDYRWLLDNYPEQAVKIRRKYKCGPDDEFDVLEYIDDECVAFVLLGHDKADTGGYHTPPQEGQPYLELTRYPNRAGVCWGVVPERPSLNAPAGHFDNVVGMYETQAALMAMEIIAVRRSIWPEPWLENPNNSAQPNIIQHPDRNSGTPGIITNGRLTTIQMDPSFRSVNTMDRLEYAQRQTAGLPSELGGMSQENVRTGRRGSQVLSASIDFTIAEVQDALAEALQEEMVRAVEISKGYFDVTKTISLSTKGARGKVTYKPSDTFEKDSETLVSYPVSGTDLSDLVINVSQRVASGLMSKRSGMENDPMVDDADAEERRVRFEGLEQAFLSSVQMQSSQPDGPWQTPDLARLAKKMFVDNLAWFEAVAELQKEKQEQQAQGAAPGAPETMPGLAMPGQGEEVPSIEEPSASLGNLSQLLGQLGTTDMALKSR